MNSWVELDLTTPVYGGETLGRLPDGRAVFVPFSLPGEKVRARLVEEKRGFARAELLEVLEPAPERIAPRCAHFGFCGGCHYQHAPYHRQLQIKTDILRDQLQRIGKIADPPVEAAVPCPDEYYYRNHIEFHLTPEGKLGYHRQSSAEVFAIQECHLPEAPLNAVWPMLEFEPGTGLQRIGLRLGAGEEVLLVLEGEEPQPPEFSVEELDLSAVYLNPRGVQVLAGNDRVMMEVLGRSFRVSAGSFFQVNTAMAGQLVQKLLGGLETSAGEPVLDVYAGVGLFSAFLAERGGRVVAVEASPSACADFAANLDEFEDVALYQATAEEVLPFLDFKPEFAVVDPPRAGLGRRALDGLLALQPGKLAYISCDPATLARDARRLVEAGYQLESVTPFDLFPQTYHIESLSFWEKG